MNSKDLRSYFDKQSGKRDQLTGDCGQLSRKIKHSGREFRQNEKAKLIVQEIGLKMQEQLQYHISAITSLALEAVFDNPYQLELDFVQRRNKTECDLYFARGDIKVDPLSASGLGAVDVASFALRVAAWDMMEPKSDNVLILDEPFKHLKGEEANIRVLQIVKEISKRLNLQIIMVSDERISREDIIENADRTFEVTIKKGVSKIKQL